MFSTVVLSFEHLDYLIEAPGGGASGEVVNVITPWHAEEDCNVFGVCVQCDNGARREI